MGLRIESFIEYSFRFTKKILLMSHKVLNQGI